MSLSAFNLVESRTKLTGMFLWCSSLCMYANYEQRLAETDLRVSTFDT